MEKEHKPVEQWKDHAHQTQAGATQEPQRQPRST